MEAIIKSINSNYKGLEFGIAIDSANNEYYFDDRHLSDGYRMSDFNEGDSIDFSSTLDNGYYRKTLLSVRLIKKASTPINEDNQRKNNKLATRYYTPGFYRGLDQSKMCEDHLKDGSGEYDILNILKRILYISHVGHHVMGDKKDSFPFCLIGATSFLKQYIHGQYEFLLVFSHFDNCSWQQNTLRAARFIRKRKEIAERRPLVNFYVLVSNARNLKQEIDKMKGGTEAAIIPFTFEELLSCQNSIRLKNLFVERFGEYLFENNMLGEVNPIEEEQLLFGERGKIADAIVQRSKEGKHSGIFGLRRSGKSSVLRAAMRRFDYEEIKYIVVEARSALEGIGSWKTALFDIAKLIRIKTLDLFQQEGETRSDFQKRLMLHSTEEDYDKRPSQCFVEDVKQYTRNDSVFVIAIDEIELITYNTATSPIWKSLDAYKGFWGALRDTGCSLIVCGVNSTINEKSSIEFNGESCDNPMYERINNCAGFSKTYLPAFTDEQTRIMINTLGGYSNISFNNIYVDINRAFGGQPYIIRQFCAYIFEHIKDLRKPNEVYEVSKPTFAAMITEFNHSNKGEQVFQTILQHIAIYRNEYEMFIKCALSPDKYKTIEREDISAIDHLVKYGLVDYDSSTCFMDISISALKEYICRTHSKDPNDMTNDERRRFVQDKVYICETKLKKYLMNYFTYNGGDSAGVAFMTKCIKEQKIKINQKAKSAPNPAISHLKDFFDHKQYIFYFSSLKTIISNNWSTIGSALNSSGMTKEQFIVYMDDLNAGRTDADHYDPEDKSFPDNWDIDNETMKKFIMAFKSFESVFDALNV